MGARTVEALKALILVGTAIFFADKLFNGTLYYYIAPRFAWLVLLAVVLLIALAQSYGLFNKGQEAEGDAAHDHRHHGEAAHSHARPSMWPLLIVAMPLILGVAVPAQPLGTSAIANRGISNEIAFAASAQSTLTIVAGERNVLDWAMAMSDNPDPAAFNGEEADVVGFVYRDPTFAPEQFMVARFVLVCCVADATPVGLVVEWAEADQLQPDTWVRVQGVFTAGARDGRPQPVLIAEAVTPMEPPAQPYLYP